tara:strand:- start:1280 stop:1594 length:315 start_codon:yes stop_codon:yes gene_type:complete
VKVKLTEKQIQNLVEAGGYDDDNIGLSDEKRILEELMKNYVSFRQSMDGMIDLLGSIVVQDRLKERLGTVKNELVDPMNSYTKFAMEVLGRNEPEEEESSEDFE